MNYLQYLLKAKGRHGTHSPFAYKFVEEALHQKGLPEKYANSIKLIDNETWAGPILHSLSLFNFSNLYIDLTTQSRFSFLSKIDNYKNSEPSSNLGDDFVLITELSQLEFYVELLPQPLPDNVNLIVLHPKNEDYVAMEFYFENDLFNYSIFTWNFSLLMKNEDFKQNQHYVLR